GYGRAIGYRYHDGKPSIIEGLLSRGDRRVAAVIEAAWRDGARFDGWTEHFSFERWRRAATAGPAGPALGPDGDTPPQRGDSGGGRGAAGEAGRARGGLGQDWRDWVDRAGAAEGGDGGGTRCYDCGVCPAMGTEIQTGPTGAKLLPLTVIGAGAGDGA